MHRTSTEIFRTLVAVFVVTAALVASLAPAASAETGPSVIDLQGQSTDLQELFGSRGTLLVFWATWCGPCRAEIPKINEVYQRFNGEGLAVLAVNPGIRDNLVNIRLYAEHFQLQYPVYFDSSQASRSAYDLIGTPTIILLDAEGREFQRGDTVDLRAIEQLMEANPAALVSKDDSPAE